MCWACRNSNSLKILCKCTIFDTLFCKYAHIGEKTEKWNLLQSPWNHVKGVTPCSCLNQLNTLVSTTGSTCLRAPNAFSSLVQVLRQPKQFAEEVSLSAQAAQAVCLSSLPKSSSNPSSLSSVFPLGTVCPQDFHVGQFALRVIGNPNCVQ